MASTAIIYELIARDSASPAFARVGAAAESLGKKYGGLQSTVTAAAKAITAATLIGAAVSVKMASDFQAAMTRVQTQAGASAKDVQELSKQVLALGNYAEQSPKELADSLYHLKSVGLDNVDAMKALRAASDLASVGNADLEQTTNAVAGAWRTGIKGAQDFGATAATLNAIIGAGNLRMEDLNDALGTGFLASAKTFGVSLTSVGSALALMTDEGVPANAAATRLRMSLSLLGAPSHQAEKQLESIGLTGLQLADTMRGPGGLVAAIGLLKDHLDSSGLSASEAAQLLSRAFGGGRSSSAILTMINNFDVLKQKQDQITASMGKFGPAVQTQRQTVQAQMKLLISSLQVTAIQIGEKLLPIANNIVHTFAAIFAWLTNLSGPTKVVFGSMAAYLAIVAPLLLIVPKAISAAKVAMAAWRLVVIAWTFATQGATAAQVAFDAAAAGNPVGLIIEGIILVIVALGLAIYELVKHWDTVWGAIKSVAETVWHAIQTAISFAWNSVILPVFNALSAAWQAVSAAFVTAGQAIASVFVWLWNTILHPIVNAAIVVFQALAAAATWLWQNILGPVFNFIGQAAIILGKILLGIVLIPLVAFWRFVLEPAALWLWHNVFQPVFNGIAAVVTFIFNNVLVPLWNALVSDWHVIEAAALWLWHNVFQPIWNGIGTAVSWVYNNILVPIWNRLKTDWIIIEAAANWMWHNVFQPVFNGIGDAISFVWHNIISPVFEALKTGISHVGDVFRVVKDGIVSVWNGIKDAVSVPVHFVVDHVVNPLIGAWDGVVDFLHLGFLHINKIPAFAAGGIVPGYTPGRDTHMAALGGGEAIMRPEWTQAAGPGYVHAANSAARNGGVGGAQQFIAQNGLPGVPGFALGGIFDWVGNVASSVGNAVKGAWNGLLKVGGEVLDFATDPVGGVKKLLDSMIGSTGTGTIEKYGRIVDMAFQWPKSLVTGLVKKITDWWGSTFGGAGGGGAAGAAPANVSGAIALGQQMAAERGWVGAQWNSLYQLWQHESGWNPHARNPSSGAFGIPQALPPGKMGAAAVAGNAGAQIAWGLNYIGGRYGSPAAAWSQWQARSPHWYAAGLMGGIFNSPTLIGVGEAGPERVDVTPLHGGHGLNGALVGGDLNVYVTSSGASATDIMREAMFELRRRRRGGVHA